jgi:hypothetical protein
VKTPEKYREDAMRCRELLDRPIKPDLRVQLRLWAAELDDMADAVERGTDGPKGIRPALVRTGCAPTTPAK